MFASIIIQQISQRKNIRTMFEHSSIHCSSKKKTKYAKIEKKNLNISSATQNYEYENEKKK